MERAKDMLMGAETVLLQLTSEESPGFDLTWGYQWHRDSVPSQYVCCLSLSVRSVSAQGQYVCCLSLSVRSVSAQGQ